jgi:hypothetical protein
MEMADFRKLLLALAAVTLVFTTVASAQLPYNCDARAVPTLVRSEGIAELAGDILLDCSGTVPAAGIQANVRVKLNTNVTSNVLSGTLLDAILLLDELSQIPPRGVGGAPNQTVYQGVLISNTEVEFAGVVLASPGSAGSMTVRITNLRANASALGSNATIFATVNITGSTTVPVDNNSLVVADTRPGLVVTVSAASYKNCVVPTTTFSVSFKEGFGSAFRPVGDADVNNTTAGGAYANESGYNPTPLANGTLTSLSSIGQATQGTRLMARFSSIPSPGVTLSVPTQLTVGANMTLQLVTGTGSDGSGGTVTSGTGTNTVTTIAVYEVTAINATSLATQETVVLPVTVSYAIPGPLGTGQVNGNFAPTSTTFTASASAPEPRFVDSATNADAFTVGACRTILLWLFVSNQAGFDTGLAISNTSTDSFGMIAQAGACKLYYYGNSSGGPGPTNPQTSTSIASGVVATWVLSTGGTHSIAAAPGFQGYIIADCAFQFAHGYAFISDVGAQKLAQGYLALIIPDRSPRDPGNRALTAFGVGFNEGEQLSN